MSFWDIVWFILITFAFSAYLMVMFSIIADIFSDPETTGIAKAVWMVLLIFVPFLTAVAYMIVRGGSMDQRRIRAMEAAQQRQADYIREVANKPTPADQIAKGRAMLSEGIISQSEFDRLKEKALV